MSAEKPEPPHRFGPFRIDTENEQLWYHQESVPLKPKAFAVLRHLVERRGKLVTKQELFAKIWPDTVVSDGALTACIKEIRKALNDAAQSPRFIETVHRRGYRFIATPLSLGRAEDERAPGWEEQLSESAQLPDIHSPLTRHSPSRFVGREPELEQLSHSLDKPSRDAPSDLHQWRSRDREDLCRRGVFDRVGVADTLLILRGQCVEQYGAGEAYLPVLDALGRLCRLHRANSCLRSCCVMLRPGWPSRPGSSTMQRSKLSSAGASEQLRSACCGRWPRVWKR